MPKQPPKNRCSTPSRSTNCSARKRTRACAVVRRTLEGFGVDAGRVGTHPRLRTPIVFCEIFPPDNFPLLFYREPKAPDLELEPEDVDLDEVRAVPLFSTTGTGLSEEPSRSTTLAALEARPEGAITVHDLDYRPMI